MGSEQFVLVAHPHPYARFLIARDIYDSHAATKLRGGHKPIAERNY